MFSKVFEKGEKWLAAYEKYLKNGKLPLELEQMKLTPTEEVKVLARRVEQQQFVQVILQLQALEMFQLDFYVLYQIWHMSDKARKILSQCDLTRFPVDTEQRQLPATESAIKEYKAVWPPQLIALLTFLSQKLMMARRFFQREAQQWFLQLTQ